MKKLFLFLSIVFCVNFTFSNTIIVEKSRVNHFLDNYYSGSYYLGKFIETKENNQIIVVSEILDLNDNSVKGYIGFNKENDEVLYLLDFNRVTQEIKAIDVKEDVTDFINLSKDNNFEKIVKIDLIGEIEKISFSPDSTLKFWGTSCGSGWSITGNDCYQTCCYYVFWINTGCEIVGC